MIINKNYILLFLLIGLIVAQCKENEINNRRIEGYIVGFDPCTINHHYRIGYYIISSDLQDTLLTYNLSDTNFMFPANVLSNNSDTLYIIPESYFQNYRNSAYFPESARYEFHVEIEYRLANNNEKIVLLCTSDINQADFNNAVQVMIISATK